jgi:hypothetical protein
MSGNPLLGVLILVLCAAAFVGFFFVPLQRFRFVHGGRRYVVHNYALHEWIWCDGARLVGTRTGGNHTSWASHAIGLPDGRHIDVRLATTDGVRFWCVAMVDGRVLFDSRSGHELPDLTWREAVREVLARLVRSVDPDVRRSACVLQQQVRDALRRLDAAERAGHEGDIAAGRAEVDRLLPLVRALDRHKDEGPVSDTPIGPS